MNNAYTEWKSPEGRKKIAEMYASGMSYAKIAKVIGCARLTLMRWLQGDTACSTAREKMEKAKIAAIKPLEDAAYRRATGYRYTEITYGYDKDGKRYVIKEVEKECPPEPSMISFLLKNKDPDNYKDKHEVETDGTVTIRFEGGSGGASWDEISG